jgi:hypothetical protein
LTLNDTAQITAPCRARAKAADQFSDLLDTIKAAAENQIASLSAVTDKK